MFLCRDAELRELNYRYGNGSFECMILYGRRRVGKTALINEFCQDKPVIYFPALRDTMQGNLEVLSRAIQNYREPDSASRMTYASFQDALEEIGRIADETRVIFVIDEYPYLAKSDPTISSRLQHLIDLHWKDGKMFLILCGSSVSFMEDEVLSYESPLYGRRTGQIHLQPMSYRDSGEFTSELDSVTKAEIFGITGGIPLYIEKLDVRRSLDEALLQNFFNPSSYLFEEPENLLKQELREPSVYNAVIKAIAEGATRLGEISSNSGIQTASCTAYLRTLMDLGIVARETPFGMKEGGRSVYRLTDPFFRFWYRFVPGNMGAIMSGRIQKTYAKSVKEYLHEYMGPIFEEMCAQYLMQYDKDLPINLNKVGRWWGTDREQKKEIEIDLIGEAAQGYRKDRKQYIAASCKFREREFNRKDLEDLEHYSRVFSPDAEFFYYAFSISGFKDEIKNMAGDHLRLVTIDDMYHE